MRWVLFLLFVSTAAATPTIYHGVVAVTNGNVTNKYCVTFDVAWFSTTLYSSLESAPRYELLEPFNGVNGCAPLTKDYTNKTVILQDSGTCTVEQRVANVQGSGLILLARITGMLNVTDVKGSKFSSAPVLLINKKSCEGIARGSSEETRVSFYIPTAKLDFNVFLIYILCVFCIVVGSYWSLYPAEMKVSEFWTTSPRPPIRLVMHSSEEENPEEGDGKRESLKNWLFGGLIVVAMAGMLLLLYFAYDYLVFVFIGLFCLIAANGVYSLLLPLCLEVELFSKRWLVSCFGKERGVSPFKILVWLACFSVTLVWFFYRQSPDVWPLQVFLGVAVCLNIIRSVPLPNLKFIAIVMMLLFVYDIFFVFITPLFTKDGVSIMEKVATGSDRPVFDAPRDSVPREQIPLSLKVPYFQDTDIKVCGEVYNLIGFGDIVIPGLLTAYSAYFDTLGHPGGVKWYFIVSCLAYAVGLAVTYAALLGMKVAQPALLYLVPCCLAGVVGTALKRGELRAVWTGRAGIAAEREVVDGDEEEEEGMCRGNQVGVVE